MNVEFVHSFVTVVDAGSLAEAARRLDITPAAVAARLRALEDELGTPLVQRAGRSVRPTEAGLRILARARSLLRDVRDLRAQAAEGALPGEFRLGVFVTALISLMPAVLQRMYAEHRDLAVFIAPGMSVQLCSRVAAGELHAAVVVEPQFVLAKDCEWQPFSEEALVLVVPAALAGEEPHALLASQPFIRYDRSSLSGQNADRYLRDHGLRPRQRLEIDNVLAIAALVDKGLGVSLLPMGPWLRNAGMAIACLPLPEAPLARRTGLMYSTRGPFSALSEALLGELRTVFAAPA